MTEYLNDTLFTFPVRDLLGYDTALIGHVTVPGCQRQWGIGLAADLARKEAEKVAQERWPDHFTGCGREGDLNWNWEYMTRPASE